MRPSLRHDSSRVQHNDLVAQGKHFLTAVGDKENRNPVKLVPLAQIPDQRGLRRTVQRSQWLIEQQRAWIGHQGPRQRDTLAFSSGNLRRSAVAQVIDAEHSKYFAASRLSLHRAERTETIRDIFLSREVRK